MAEARPQSTAMRMIQSYGITNKLVSYMPSKEATKLQAICRFLYEIGIGRSQASIMLYPPVYFYNPANLEKLYVLNSRS